MSAVSSPTDPIVQRTSQILRSSSPLHFIKICPSFCDPSGSFSFPEPPVSHRRPSDPVRGTEPDQNSAALDPTRPDQTGLPRTVLERLNSCLGNRKFWVSTGNQTTVLHKAHFQIPLFSMWCHHDIINVHGYATMTFDLMMQWFRPPPSVLDLGSETNSQQILVPNPLDPGAESIGSWYRILQKLVLNPLDRVRTIRLVSDLNLLH